MKKGGDAGIGDQPDVPHKVVPITGTILLLLGVPLSIQW
jgi:hypothetical protein